MTKPIGGRGYKAPYTTTHVRVPTDIKPEVELLIDNYRNKILGITTEKALTPIEEKALTPIEEKALTPIEEVLTLVDEILARKQSARKSMGLLLSAIYGKEIILQPLDKLKPVSLE
jgi:hypothetical protein